MPDQDRLEQLRKQRANIVEQLAWLDNEIANTLGEPEPPEQTVADPEPVAQSTEKILSFALRRPLLPRFNWNRIIQHPQ